MKFLLLPPRSKPAPECPCDLCEKSRQYIRDLERGTKVLLERNRRSEVITGEDLATVVY